MVLVDDAVVMTVTRKASAVVAAQKLRGTLQRKVDARIAERTDASGTVLKYVSEGMIFAADTDVDGGCSIAFFPDNTPAGARIH